MLQSIVIKSCDFSRLLSNKSISIFNNSQMFLFHFIFTFFIIFMNHQDWWFVHDYKVFLFCFLSFLFFFCFVFLLFVGFFWQFSNRVVCFTKTFLLVIREPRSCKRNHCGEVQQKVNVCINMPNITFKQETWVLNEMCFHLWMQRRGYRAKKNQKKKKTKLLKHLCATEEIL